MNVVNAAEHTHAPHCAGCGYDLHGIDSLRCPECGVEVDLLKSRIPWTHRRTLGSVAAFLQTVGDATLRPAQFGDEIDGPVSIADARRFRLICILVPWLTCAAALGYIIFTTEYYGLANGSYFDSTYYDTWLHAALWEQLTAFCVVCAALGIFFFWSNSTASLFLSKRIGTPQKARAVALSYYGAAPLFWIVIPVALNFGWTLIQRNGTRTGFGSNRIDSDVGGIESIAACLSALILMAGFSSATIVSRCSKSRMKYRWRIILGLCLIWLLELVVSVIAFPLAALFVGIVIYSFR